MKLLDKIKSEQTALYLTFAAVIVLFPNVFYVFNKVAGEMPIPYLREIQAFLVALYISWSIVYFALKKDLKASVSFAIFEMLISVMYYWLRLMFNDYGDFEINFYIIPSLLIACFLPWSVKYHASSTVSLKHEPIYKSEFVIKSIQNEYFEKSKITEDHNDVWLQQKLSDYKNEILQLNTEKQTALDTIVINMNKHIASMEQLKSEKAWLKDIVLKNATKITPAQAIKLNEI